MKVFGYTEGAKIDIGEWATSVDRQFQRIDHAQKDLNKLIRRKSMV